tara:strand:- start:108 stop:314 length:207 start_codon:yes stop_codon:yes gene_type:complete
VTPLRTISKQLKLEGKQVGRYKVRNLMKEAGIVSKQSRKHRYKAANQEAKIAANLLKREFAVKKPNQI